MRKPAGKSWRSRNSRVPLGRKTATVATAFLFVVAMALTAQADRTELRPGFNLFSAQQDIQIGQQQTQQAVHQLPMLNDSKVDNYLNQLGHRLSAHAPGYKYPYNYRCVNDMAINAFALPGGSIFINRGVIENADDEAQLAGVMAHETSHVALRHGTNQASKAYAAQVPLSILGGVLGSNSIGAVLGRLGAQFGLSSVFLKMSRTDETQADVLGTQIMYDAGYDPRGMSQFFEKIMAESKSHPVQFFSDHPNPDNRIARVDEEINKLGGPPPHAKTDSPEFQEIKRYVMSLPRPKGSKGPTPGNSGSSGNSSRNVPSPSTHFVNFQGSQFQISHPDNWQSYGQGNVVTLAPQGGIIQDSQGNSALAEGMIISTFQPHSDSGQLSLEQATDQLVTELQHSNPHMSIVRQHEQFQINGQTALSTYLSNDSPAGGRESDWLVTLARPDGLMYLVGVAPQNQLDRYDAAFQKMVNSLRLS